MKWRHCIIGVPVAPEQESFAHELHDGRVLHVLAPGERPVLVGACDDTWDDFLPETVKIPLLANRSREE
jgi:hypothetical protein